MKHLDRSKRWAGKLKVETYALYSAYGDPRVPQYTRSFAAQVVGYAFSPIDPILVPGHRARHPYDPRRNLLEIRKPVSRTVAVWLVLGAPAVYLVADVVR